MKTAAPALLLALALAGCGGSASNPALTGELAPGYYAVTARLLQSGNAARDYTGRVSVAPDGTVRLFGIDLGGSRVTLSSTPGQANPDGTNATAILDGVASTGELFTLVDNLVSFAGVAFDLTSNGTAAPLPIVGGGRSLAAGNYSGELVRVGTDGAVIDWGNATATLSITTPNAGPPVNTLQANLVPAAGTSGIVSATLATNGTATSASTTSGAWSSDGSGFTLRLTGSAAGSGNLFIVLTRQAP